VPFEISDFRFASLGSRSFELKASKPEILAHRLILSPPAGIFHDFLVIPQLFSKIPGKYVPIMVNLLLHPRAIAMIESVPGRAHVVIDRTRTRMSQM
jgi:hypothetical protein